VEKCSWNEGWTVEDETGKRKNIVLPHDAMIERCREPGCASGSAQGFFPGGRYVYEKQFDVPKEWRDKEILLQFEGVYKNAEVYINGERAGGCPYGYIPFFVCLSKKLKYGEKNVVRVEADNREQPESRWYTGAGIYRPVWLWMGEEAHLLPEGIRITTVDINTAETDAAQIKVEISYTGKIAAWDAEIFFDGQPVAEAKSGQIIADETEGALCHAQAQIEIPNARLWSEETPDLYQCHVSIWKEEDRCGNPCDASESTFGIRMVTWGRDGLFINGKNTLLRGGCIHHDNGILGAACYAKSEERKIRRLKEAGFNAVRSSHNPASQALLEACDRYGVYVMDEGWDMWYFHKNQYDYASFWRECHEDDLRAMVSRDYNHPSVIMYSIGNEVSEPAKEEGVRMTQALVAFLKKEDSTRAVTAGFNLSIIHGASKGKGVYNEEGGMKKEDGGQMSGMNSTMFNMIASIVGTGMNKAANSEAANRTTSPSLKCLDIAGYNYASGRYPLDGRKNPGRLIVGSETFPQDIAKNWKMVEKYPYLVGDFMWTCWDYLGEAGLGAWAYTKDAQGFKKPYPWLLADCGAFDILGNKGAPAAYAEAVWGRTQVPYIGVRPVNHPKHSYRE